MLNSYWFDLLIGNVTPDLMRTLRLEDVQVFFEVGDRVGFSASDVCRLSGTIEKLNPKSASVRRGDDRWLAPYFGLNHLCKSTADERQPRGARLREVAMEARELMDRHGLEEWTLQFNVAWKKLGECRSREKLILLSRPRAVTNSLEQVTDTILHEIAHALAGPEAGHGTEWKDIARAIGATPKSCVPESDEKHRHRQNAKRNFRRGDAVSVTIRSECRTGMIERMNPKRAKVRFSDGVWLVPYDRLNAVSRLEDESNHR